MIFYELLHETTLNVILHLCINLSIFLNFMIFIN